MKYNELQVQKQKRGNRVGRGISAGQGKTAGRGTKGYGSRTGSKKKPGFEGGQTPLMQKLPKLPGFTSHTLKAENVHTDQLNTFTSGTVDNFTLAEAGLTSSPYVRVKLIARGEVTPKLKVILQGASETAVAAIQKAGGTFEKIARVQRQTLEKNVTKKTDKAEKAEAKKPAATKVVKAAKPAKKVTKK